MYTLKINISPMGSLYNDPDNPHYSKTGHMWYTISDGVNTHSFGFAPVQDGEPLGPGQIKINDDNRYPIKDYTGTISIDYWQFDILKNFGNENNLNGVLYDFSTEYNGANNNCIDYVWKALELVNINLTGFEGESWPTWNSDNIDALLYETLFGMLDGWDSSKTSGSNYDVIYGSKEDDTVYSRLGTDAIYGGKGDDKIHGNPYSLYAWNNTTLKRKVTGIRLKNGRYFLKAETLKNLKENK